MALKPSYNDKLHLPGLSKTEILILALEASQKAGVEYRGSDSGRSTIRSPVQYVFSWRGNNLYHRTGKRRRSSCAQPIFFRTICRLWKEQKKIYKKLRETMEEIKTSLTPEELTQKAKDFEEECNRPLTEEEKAYLEEEKRRGTLSGRSLFPAKVLWQRLS